MSEKQKRGFANLTAERRAEISSAGGKAAHAKGRAHRWTVGSAEASEAGRKGGSAVRKARA